MEKYLQKGFTLVEILIAVGIIVLIAGIAIPNLRSFSEDTTLSQAANNVSENIRKVQANAFSGVKCSTGDISTSWSVFFIPAQNRFELICNYSVDNIETSITEESITLAEIDLSVTCGEEVPDDKRIVFASVSVGASGIIRPCLEDMDFKVTLESQKTGQTHSVSIDANGIILEE